MTRSTKLSVLAAVAAAGLALPAQAHAQTAAPADQGEPWTVKPRGRLQLDLGSINPPPLDLPGNEAMTGTDTRVRRAFLGVDGTIPGGFGFRLEADFASDPVQLTDAYLYYKPNKQLTITAGQQKPFWGLEEMTSDLFTSFQERASFTSGFGFERRLGVSAAWAGKEVLVQGGVFSDDVVALGFPNSSATPKALDDSYSFDGRVVYMPKLGSAQLHLGGSVHYRLFKNPQSVRYRARPFVRTTDLRFVDTRSIAGVDGELGLGLEAAYIDGPFHATAESFWQKALRPGLVSPTFNGGYVEAGYMLTKGDRSGYKGGAYDRIKPKNPLGKGGVGAVQLNARYDWFDLNDAGIVGGKQQTAGLSLVWVPADRFKFIADYGHLWISDSPIAAQDGRSDYEADAFGLRAQFDF